MLTFKSLEEVKATWEERINRAERQSSRLASLVDQHANKKNLDNFERSLLDGSLKSAGGIYYVKEQLRGHRATVQAFKYALECVDAIVPDRVAVRPAGSYNPVSDDTAECPWCLKLIQASTRIDQDGYLICQPCKRHFDLTACRSFSPGRWAAPGNNILYCESCDQDILEEDYAVPAVADEPVQDEPASPRYREHLLDGHGLEEASLTGDLKDLHEELHAMFPELGDVTDIPDCDYCGAVGESQHSPSCINA